MAAARAAYLKSPEAQTTATRDSLFKPFDSGPIDGQGPARQVVVNVTGLKELRLVATCDQGPGQLQHLGRAEAHRQGRLGHATHRAEADLRQSRLGPVAGRQELAGSSACASATARSSSASGFTPTASCASRWTAATSGSRRWSARIGTARRAWSASRCSPRRAPLPSAWADVASKFPTQAGWLRADAGGDGIASWFGNRQTAELEQEILGTVLRQIAPADAPFRAEIEALAQANAAPGDPRWLGLYARACRYRQCVSLRRAPSRRLQPELDALVAAKAADDDPRWDALRARAVQAAELDDQFATLQFDIRQREVLSKTDERANLERRPLRPDRALDGRGDRQAGLSPRVADSARGPRSGRHRRAADRGAAGRPEDDRPRRPSWPPSTRRWRSCSRRSPTRRWPTPTRGGSCSTTPAGCAGRSPSAIRCLNFDKLVFIKRHRAFYHHMCDQFYGICQNPGGGLYVLENAFGANPPVRDVLAGSVCETGRLQGQKLSGGSVAAAQPPLRRPEGTSAATTPRAARSSRPRCRPTAGRSPSPTSSARARKEQVVPRRPDPRPLGPAALLPPLQGQRGRHRPASS